MNLVDFFNISNTSKDYLNKMLENSSDYEYLLNKIRYIFDYINNIEDTSIKDRQNKIIKENFENINNIQQFFDKIIELLVFYKLINEKEDPEFIKTDNINKLPDVKIKNERFVEIKRIRNSDYQNGIIENLLKNKKENEINIFEDETKINIEYEKLNILEKAEYHINKALEQLKNKNGFIYLVYNMDILLNQLEIKMRNEVFYGSIDEYFEKYCNDFFKKLSIDNIKVIIIKEKELYK